MSYCGKCGLVRHTIIHEDARRGHEERQRQPRGKAGFLSETSCSFADDGRRLCRRNGSHLANLARIPASNSGSVTGEPPVRPSVARSSVVTWTLSLTSLNRPPSAAATKYRRPLRTVPADKRVTQTALLRCPLACTACNRHWSQPGTA